MCDLPDVSERIADHRAPITVRGIKRLLERSRAGGRHHDEGVTDSDFGGPLGVVLARGIEHVPEKFDLGYAFFSAC